MAPSLPLTFLALLLDGAGLHTVTAALQTQRARARVGLHVTVAPRALRVSAIWGWRAGRDSISNSIFLGVYTSPSHRLVDECEWLAFRLGGIHYGMIIVLGGGGRAGGGGQFVV